MNTLLVIGALGLAVVAFLKRCEWFDVCGELSLDELIGQHNSLPTIADNPKTSNYRSTLLTKADPKVVSRKIQDQSDFSNPKTAAAVKQYMGGSTKVNTTPRPPQKYPCNTGLCASSGLHTRACAHCPGSKASYATAYYSLFNTGRVSI